MLYCGYGNFTGEEDDLMQDRKLEQALEIYFQENPDRESDKYQEIQKYLKLKTVFFPFWMSLQTICAIETADFYRKYL